MCASDFDQDPFLRADEKEEVGENRVTMELKELSNGQERYQKRIDHEFCLGSLSLGPIQ